MKNMQKCSIYDKSLKFSRFIYGIVILLAYFIQSKELVLLVSILTIMGAFSLSFNIPYQIHILVEKYFLKKDSFKPTNKDLGEINFVSGATGILLLIGFLLLQYTDHTTFAWAYIMIVASMIFLACIIGFCAATLMYVVIKNKFNHKTN